MRQTVRQAFTLLETLLVISIVASLAAIAGVSVYRVYDKATDTKRLYDVRQIQQALERYAEGNGGFYPEDQEFIVGGSLVSKNGHVVYLKIIPHNLKAGGGCPQADYLYRQGANGRSYTLSYCLASNAQRLIAGPCMAMPGLVCARPQCSCNEVSKNCCGYCRPGDTCGGGILAAPNYNLNGESFTLVADNLDVGVGLAWDDGVFLGSTGATSETDGAANSALLNDDRYQAARICANLSQNNFSDWYLPSAEEETVFYNSQILPASGTRWTSTEVGDRDVKTLNLSTGQLETLNKNSKTYFDCLRKSQ